MKKKLILMTIFVVMMSLVTISFATVNNGNDNGFHVKIIDESEIPEGIVPIVVNSDSEALEIVKKHTKMVNDNSRLSKKEIIRDEFVSEDQMKESMIQALATSSTTSSTKSSYRTYGAAKFKVYANIDILSAAGARYITDINYDGCKLTGITLGLGLSDKHVSSSISGGGKQLNVSAEATLDHYLIIEGVVKVYSKDISHSFTYRVD